MRRCQAASQLAGMSVLVWCVHWEPRCQQQRLLRSCCNTCITLQPHQTWVAACLLAVRACLPASCSSCPFALPAFSTPLLQCGEEGHIARDCPTAPAGGPGGPGGGGGGGGRGACFNVSNFICGSCRLAGRALAGGCWLGAGLVGAMLCLSRIRFGANPPSGLLPSAF